MSNNKPPKPSIRELLAQKAAERMASGQRGGVDTTSNKTLDLKLVMLPLAALRENPNNPRTEYADLEELAESLRTDGLKVPLEVKPLGNQTFMIEGGHRRFRAAQLAGLETLPCIIGQLGKQVTTAKLSAIENAARRDLSPIDTLRLVKSLLDEHEDLASVANTFGWSKPNASRVVACTKFLSPEFESVVKDSGFRGWFTLGALANKLSHGTACKIVEYYSTLGSAFVINTLPSLPDDGRISAAIDQELARLKGEAGPDRASSGSLRRNSRKAEKVVTLTSGHYWVDVEKRTYGVEFAVPEEASIRQAVCREYADRILRVAGLDLAALVQEAVREQKELKKKQNEDRKKPG